jgi:hypothetical protein
MLDVSESIEIWRINKNIKLPRAILALQRRPKPCALFSGLHGTRYLSGKETHQVKVRSIYRLGMDF